MAPDRTIPSRAATTERSDGLQIAEDLLHAIGTVRRATRRRAGRPPELASLTGAQLELVRLLRLRPGLSINEAAIELSLAPNTVSTLVGQLSAGGAIRRVADAADRRVARLELAPGLAHAVEVWRDRRALALSDAIARLPVHAAAALPMAVAALGDLARELDGSPRE